MIRVMRGPLPSKQTASILKTLSRSSLFAGLSEGDLEQVLDFVVPKKIGKGEYLFHADEPCLGFYIVQSGAINLHRVHSGGREQVIHMVRPGESFAECALTMENGYPADARAVVITTVLFVQRAGFLELLKTKPEMSLRMLTSMSAHLRELVQQIEDMTLKDVESRLANWLLNRCPDISAHHPVEIDLNVTKRVLAAELGTVAETLSRTLSKFRQEGWVEVNGRLVTVHDPAALNAMLRRHLGECS